MDADRALMRECRSDAARRRQAAFAGPSGAGLRDLDPSAERVPDAQAPEVGQVLSLDDIHARRRRAFPDSATRRHGRLLRAGAKGRPTPKWKRAPPPSNQMPPRPASAAGFAASRSPGMPP